MDLTNMIPGGAGEEKTPQQQLSKEEYAAMKKQQREEVWAEVDAQAQAVFQNGDSLKGFLDFMAQCNTQKTPNLLLIYGQNPEATVVKSYDYWKKEHRSPKSGCMATPIWSVRNMKKTGRCAQAIPSVRALTSAR